MNTQGFMLEYAVENMDGRALDLTTASRNIIIDGYIVKAPQRLRLTLSEISRPHKISRGDTKSSNKIWSASTKLFSCDGFYPLCYCSSSTLASWPYARYSRLLGHPIISGPEGLAPHKLDFAMRNVV